MTTWKARAARLIVALAPFGSIAGAGNGAVAARAASSRPVPSRASGGSSPAVIFLDAREGVVNGSTTYDPETRSCGQGTYRVFTDIDQAAAALSGADVLYVRAGTYCRASAVPSIVVHGNEVNYWTGTLDITAGGTPERRKLVRAYRHERVVIQAKAGASRYNPEPGDTGFKNSSHYYPHPAIGIHGAYVDVAGFKTYGQVVITGHDITIQGCDLGGGGPHMNQGQVVALNGTGRPGGVHDVVIRNNRIHHSCWGESTGNGAALMGYDFSPIVENNWFFDNYGPDVSLKDTGGQRGREIIVRYNFFGPTSIRPKGNPGVTGMNQDKEIDRILIHNNIFQGKWAGIGCDGPPRAGMFIYNNTFIDCGRDITEWTNPVIHAHNNIHYHSEKGQAFYDIQSIPWSRLKADHNLFFSVTGETRWRHRDRDRGSSLAGWQRYSGAETHSVWRDPDFVDPAGSRPGDFKRKGDPKSIRDVAGSKYGPVCGAYVTGDEHIGPISHGKASTASDTHPRAAILPAPLPIARDQQLSYASHGSASGVGSGPHAAGPGSGSGGPPRKSQFSR